MKLKTLGNIFKRFYNSTLLGKFTQTLISLKNYIVEYNYISDTLYSENFKIVLKKYLHVDFKKDWIGRLYGVINPNLDINGQVDVNNIIIELDDENTNNIEFVKHWAYKQLNLIADLFKINKLYNYINLRFFHVGPKNSDNFLLIFDLTSRVEFAYFFKKFLKHLSVYIIISAIVLSIIFYI